MTITILAKAKLTFDSFVLQLKQEAIHDYKFVNCHGLQPLDKNGEVNFMNCHWL